ncbi:MAG: hypothetical protein OHK0023_02530 [Anaerolineae bacterium]
MPVLTFANPDGVLSEYAFPDGDQVSLSLVASQEGRFMLRGGLPDAVIARSRVYQVPVLVNLGGSELIRVNGRRVVELRVLRQGNEIQVGDLLLTFWEMILQDVARGAPLTRQVCPICRMRFAEGDAAITCPRCGLAHHKECWFEHEYCSNQGCMYPIRTTLKRLLSARGVTIEALPANSPLVQQGKKCLAGTPGVDAEPFSSGQTVAYCPNPNCNGAFHLECWVSLDDCPSCGKYNVNKLLRAIFVPGAPPYLGEFEAVSQEEA